MGGIDGKVVWIADADEPQGKAVALALAAAGARVLVTGANERAVAECVGEIAHGGGKARHFVARGVERVDACVAAARERFGALDAAVVAHGAGGAARSATGNLVRVIEVAHAADEASAVAHALEALA